jgi:hypothetical protein
LVVAISVKKCKVSAARSELDAMDSYACRVELTQLGQVFGKPLPGRERGNASSIRERFTMRHHLWVGLPLVWLLLATPTMAGAVLVFDENGGGFATSAGASFPLTSFFPIVEPISGVATLAYDIAGSPAVGLIPSPGDVVITEPNSTNQSNSDLLRFSNQGLVYVFSDAETSEPLDKADVGVPTPMEPFITVVETGLNGLPYGEGFNGILYTPGPTDPGFVPGGITYEFISDGSVPEPATLVSLGIGMAIVGSVCRKRRHQRG